MSTEQEKEVPDPKRQVVITPEDCEAAFEFWDHFQIPKIPELQESLTAFKAEPTFENQKKILMAVTKAIGFTDHEAFKDEIFTKIVPECRAEYANLAFDEEIKKVLTPEEEVVAKPETPSGT
jgi:hypothetical protein